MDFAVSVCSSSGPGPEQQCPGRVRHRGGAAGSRTSGAAVSSQEDQAGRHDQAVAAGQFIQPVIMSVLITTPISADTRRSFHSIIYLG